MLKLKGYQKLPMHETIPTPSFGLNHALGGGLWTGRFHTFWGNPSAGKSTLALHTLANAQEMGYTPIVIDSEGSITDAWREKCGIDTSQDQSYIVRKTNVEDILSIMLPAMRVEGSKCAFLLDSINTMVADIFYKKDESQGGLGVYARSQTMMMQKLANEVIANTDHIVILIAQQTYDLSNTNVMAVPKIGNAVNHWNTNTIKFFASQAKDSVERDKDRKITDHEVFWTISKSKQRAVMGTTGGFWYNPSTAKVDRKQEIFNIAVRNGIITRKGSYYVVGDESFQGKPKAMENITDNMWDKIEGELSGKEELSFEFDDTQL